MQVDFNHARQVSPRLLEQTLQEEDEDLEWDEVAEEEEDEDD
jgi:hypothetical protein